MSTEKDKNKAVITVVGCDAVGIIAKISALLAEEMVRSWQNGLHMSPVIRSPWHLRRMKVLFPYLWSIQMVPR